MNVHSFKSVESPFEKAHIVLSGGIWCSQSLNFISTFPLWFLCLYSHLCNLMPSPPQKNSQNWPSPDYKNSAVIHCTHSHTSM